jgi:hypothetical protein
MADWCPEVCSTAWVWEATYHHIFRQAANLHDACGVHLCEPGKQEDEERVTTVQNDLKVLRTEVIPQGDPEVPLPMNLMRLVQKAQGLFGTADEGEFGPVEVITGVKKLLGKLIVVPGKDGLSEEAQRNATVLLLAHVRSVLASKRVRVRAAGCADLPRTAWCASMLQEASLMLAGEPTVHNLASIGCRSPRV